MNPLAQARAPEPPAADVSQSKSPRKVGRFELIEEIGKGSMGVVYLARDPMIGRWVAVKKLTGIKGKSLEPDGVRRLLINEARNVGALQHPGIVTVFDIVEDRFGKVEALAMEYVAGKSLRQRLNEPEPISLWTTSEILTTVADVLDHAHASGCIHRDIKPANVLLGHGGVIKVADFGIAALRGESLAIELRNLGTPNYLAPERVMGQPGDHRADIYSLGVILYELLTRHLPFEAASIAALVQKIAQEEPTPPERFVPELMPGLKTILERSLAKDPDDRYQTATKLAADVREIVDAQAALNDTVPASFGRSAPQPVEAPTPATAALPVPDTVTDSEPEPGGESDSEPDLVDPVELIDWEAISAQAPESEPEAVEVLSDPSEVLAEALAEMPAAAPEAMGEVEEAQWEPAEQRSGAEPWPARVASRLAPAIGRLGKLSANVAAVIRTTAQPPVRRGVALAKERPLVAAVLVFLLALPLLLMTFRGRPESRLIFDNAARVETEQRYRYLSLLRESRALFSTGLAQDAQAAQGILVRAEPLFPETRDEVRHEAMLESLLIREADRLVRIDAVIEAAHLRIARQDFRGAQASIDELEVLDAPAVTLELLEDSLAQAELRLRRARRRSAPKPEVVVVAQPRIVTPKPRPVAVARPAPKTGPGTLRVEFSSARPRGVLTIYSGEQQVLNRRYRFVEKKNFFVRKGVSGDFEESITLPEGTRNLRIYLSQPKRPTQLEPVTIEIPPGDIRTLRLRVQADGKFVVTR